MFSLGYEIGHSSVYFKTSSSGSEQFVLLHIKILDNLSYS